MENLEAAFRAMVFGNPLPDDELEEVLAVTGLNRRQFHRSYREYLRTGKSASLGRGTVSGEERITGKPVLVVDMHSVFDRVVVLNLPRRSDRLREFQHQLVRMPGGWPHRAVEVVRAVDGATGAVPTPTWFRQGGGAYGCWRSHLNVLENALVDGISSVYILEDDAVFDADYTRRMKAFLNAVPADWEALFPGGQHHGPSTPVAPGVVRCSNIQRTHCYAIRGRDVIQHLYRMWTEWPVQNPYRDFHCDWLLGPWTGLRKTYAPERFFVGQGRTVSDINGRLNPFQAWNPPDPSAPVLWLRNSSRKTLEGLLRYGCHPGYDRDEQGGDRGLNEVFASTPGTGAAIQMMQRWAELLQTEVESMFRPAAIVCIWHPDSERHEPTLRAVYSAKRLLIVEKDGVEEALSIWRQHRRNNGLPELDHS